MNQKKNSEKSMGYFNLIRGIGMFLIIWGHSANIFKTYQIREWSPFYGAGSVLGGGIMAMFFLVSGYSFYKRSPRKCFSIQKKSLLYPYLLTAAAVLISKLLLSILKRRPFMKHGGEYIMTYLLGLNAEGGGSLLGIPIESVSIFWFVLALFGGWIIYNYIVQFKSQRVQWILIGSCMFLAWLLGLVSKVWVFCLPQALAAVFFLAMGVVIRQHNLLERKIPVWGYGLMGILLFICAAFGQVDMVNCIWRLGPVDIAGSCCCGFLLLKIYGCVMRHMPKGIFVSLLESAGFYSMWIICLHCYEKVIVPWYRLKWVFPENPLVGTVVCMILRLLLIYVMYRAVSPVIARVNRMWRKQKRKLRNVN